MNEPNGYAGKILKVLVHIQNNLDEQLEAGELAKMAFYSGSHFHRVFKGMVGETLGEHIRRLRLERASHRLAYGNMSVLDISLEAGYDSPESLSRAFKSMFDLTPSRFRVMRRAMQMPAIPCGVHYVPEAAPANITFIPRGGNIMDVRIANIDPIKVAFVRHVGPYAECEPAWNTLCAWAGPKGLFGPETRFIGISYDDPSITPPEKIRYDASMTISGDLQPEGEIGIQTIPGGRYAVHTHEGSYRNLEKTYAALMGQWMPEHGEEMRNCASFEVYLNDPKTTPEDELLTDIYIPLK